jgi:hypothetical protein
MSSCFNIDKATNIFYRPNFGLNPQKRVLLLANLVGSVVMALIGGALIAASSTGSPLFWTGFALLGSAFVATILSACICYLKRNITLDDYKRNLEKDAKRTHYAFFKDVMPTREPSNVNERNKLEDDLRKDTNRGNLYEVDGEKIDNREMRNRFGVVSCYLHQGITVPVYKQLQSHYQNQQLGIYVVTLPQKIESTDEYSFKINLLETEHTIEIPIACRIVHVEGDRTTVFKYIKAMMRIDTQTGDARAWWSLHDEPISIKPGSSSESS